MTENDPLEIIKSDERSLPPEDKPKQKTRDKTYIEHMFEEAFREWRKTSDG